MKNTLDKKSGIAWKKTKFFTSRAVTYSLFLLMPIWLQKFSGIDLGLQIIMMFLYILFMVGQWFFLGKEIDHRLEIYFKVNSSIDRSLYRIFLGMMVTFIYFNLIGLLPVKWIINMFWTTWAILGLFYSWPTRGKIIEESVTSTLGELTHLDAFEKMLLFVIVFFFVISVPEMPLLSNYEALKFFFDPHEITSSYFWNFLFVNYIPFYRYPELLKIAWCMHFYVIGLGLFLLIFYALLRFFFCRRLALLGVFAILTSWSFVKILANGQGLAITSTYALFWIWSLIWVSQSASYRTGLFLGLVMFWGASINISYSFLFILQIIFLWNFLLRDKTRWFKRKVIRYASFGLILTLLTLISHWELLEDYVRDIQIFHSVGILENLLTLITRKSFNIIALLGMIILVAKYFYPNEKMFSLKIFSINKRLIATIYIMWGILLIYSIIFGGALIREYSMLWPVIILALVPIEFLFQSISKLRSGRNLIYLFYILICLLDSHLEVRVKSFLKYF